MVQIIVDQDARWGSRKQQDAHAFITWLMKQLRVASVKSGSEAANTWINFYLDNCPHIHDDRSDINREVMCLLWVQGCNAQPVQVFVNGDGRRCVELRDPSGKTYE